MVVCLEVGDPEASSRLSASDFSGKRPDFGIAAVPVLPGHGKGSDRLLKLGSVSSKYIEFKICKDKMPANMNTVKVDYGILINNALTVAQVHAMLVGTLNGIKVRSLTKNDSSFEMIPIRHF